MKPQKVIELCESALHSLRGWEGDQTAHFVSMGGLKDRQDLIKAIFSIMSLAAKSLPKNVSKSVRESIRYWTKELDIQVDELSPKG
jgi:hypothetical protein